MADPIITNVDTGHVIHSEAHFRDELLTLAGADTIASGTILARDSVSLKLVLFVKGGSTNENGIPKAVYTQIDDLVVTGAGDSAIRAMVEGFVRKERLIIDADGDGSAVDNAVLDQLRDFGITAVNTTELGQLDNQ